jgi:CysZ protein
MLQNITFAFNNYFKAFNFIKTNNLKKYYIIPGLINFILMIGFYFFSRYLSESVLNLFNKFLGGGANSIIQLVLQFIVYLLIFGIYYLIYKTLILIILSPFLSYISERVETTITKKEFNFSLKENFYFIKRGIVVTLKSFLRELFFTGIILILFFIPLINIIVPILLFIVQSYYIGFSFIDYTLERHDYNTGTNIIRKNPLFFLINGGFFTLFLFIPIVGIFIAPLVTVVATTTGTLKLIEDEESRKMEENL